MGIFSRKKDSEFNPNAEKVENITYSGIEDALSKVLNKGSADTRVITLKFETGDVVKVLATGTKVRYAYRLSNTGDFLSSFGARLEFSAQKHFSEDDLASVAFQSQSVQGFAESDLFDVFVHVRTQAAKDFVASLIVLETKKVFAEFADVKVIYAAGAWELRHPVEVIESFAGADMDFSQLISVVRNEIEKTAKAASFLADTSIDQIRVVTNNPKDVEEAKTDVEKLILITGLAENATVETVLEKGRFFSLYEIYMTLSGLMWNNVIELIFPETETESADDLDFNLGEDELVAEIEADLVEDDLSNVLPVEIVETLTTENYGTDDVIPDTIEVVEDDSDGWEFAKPEMSDSDDGGFDFVSTDSYSDGTDGIGKAFVLKPYINTVVRESSNLSAENISDLNSLNDYNSELEISVTNLEQEIKKKKSEYDSKYGNYQSLAIETVNSQIVSEIKVNESDNLHSVRNESNELWFELEELERQRHALNQSREKSLKKIESIVTEADSAHVQECINIIEIKINGIRNVTNFALHTAKDDEEELARFNYEQEAAEDDGFVPFTEVETPIFFKLVREFGADLIA